MLFKWWLVCGIFIKMEMKITTTHVSIILNTGNLKASVQVMENTTSMLSLHVHTTRNIQKAYYMCTLHTITHKTLVLKLF